MLFAEFVALPPPTHQHNPELDSTHSMLSAHAPPFTPAADQVDHEMIRQKRLQKFLLNCAKVGAQAPLPLNAAKQDNATFDTMLEVAAECEITGIPTPHRPYACPLPPLPPTPETGAANCIWDVFTGWESWTPNIPEDDGVGEYPNFPKVFASFLTSDGFGVRGRPQPHSPVVDASFLTCSEDCDGYGEDYDPTKDPLCVAYRKDYSCYADYDPTKDPDCVAYEGYRSEDDVDTRDDENIAYGTYY